MVEELEITALQPDDVLVHLPFSGICHTDLHMVTGHLTPAMLPMIGGHEGAGVVEDVGSNVTNVKPGDSVVLSIVPACGTCRYCVSGRSSICDYSTIVLDGRHPDGGTRYRTSSGAEAGQWALLGTFAEYVVVNSRAAIPMDPSIGYDKASMVGCAFTTGFGAATEKAQVHTGDVVAVWGCGGVGLSAVQGAAVAGAAQIFAIDTKDLKLDKAVELGATTAINAVRDRSPNPNRDEVAEKVMEYTQWVGADVVILCVDYVTPELVGAAFEATRKGGRVVVVGASHQDFDHVKIPPLQLAMYEKEIVGCVYGGGNPALVLPRNLDLYQRGKVKLDEMITRYYPLEDVNRAFDDLLNGEIVKGILRF
ncbi:alcohol dehydrogenase catalytic domain-containing protein (plasmid) [Rhodococcus sp. USK10]|uniref:alcohol dehydrogenase catalytic domain-containing protein n=1 Tax=Rhodococcus sp. USK10 TaxID=2789739 RepID=UPI001C5EBFCF|nr:alcohol dehydrogenase catalytic domain-containing protein [Rhodococcus sp. USK10]QYB00184.1 alcohol dehydrogenase catalytic domain-containing protein [Rhodococcus sp. USK10]